MAVHEAEKIYIEYSTELYRYFLSLTHSSTDAEDLLSETFIRALKKLPSFRGDSSVRTWLYSIARNVWFEFIRKSRDALNLDDMLEVYIDDSILDAVSNSMLAERVRLHLMNMDERAQKVVLMRSEGYSYDEISGKLQITSNSARVIEHRTKKKLKELLIREGFIDG
ncbi:MAG: RNA polymerase sigma factor [Eubacteriales bacterium]|nr:RNA polymerase sigma factor [Eubacteriales bacterium]